MKMLHQLQSCSNLVFAFAPRILQILEIRKVMLTISPGTFIKWQHIAVLLAVLSLSLYNAAGESNKIARALAIVYLLIAAFTGLWGLGIYHVRNRMIKARSGKDFDNILGPLVVCGSLVVALCVNFGLKVHGTGLT